jgi:hypothetical protein
MKNKQKQRKAKKRQERVKAKLLRKKETRCSEPLSENQKKIQKLFKNNLANDD